MRDDRSDERPVRPPDPSRRRVTDHPLCDLGRPLPPAARRRNRWRGPLHGIPVAGKDNIDTAGVRTTGASALFKDRIPEEDADVLARLKKAGAVPETTAVSPAGLSSARVQGGPATSPLPPAGRRRSATRPGQRRRAVEPTTEESCAPSGDLSPGCRECQVATTGTCSTCCCNAQQLPRRTRTSLPLALPAGPRRRRLPRKATPAGAGGGGRPRFPSARAVGAGAHPDRHAPVHQHHRPAHERRKRIRARMDLVVTPACTGPCWPSGANAYCQTRRMGTLVY